MIPALWAPAIAFAAAFALLLAIYWVFRWLTPGIANRSFRLGQLASGTWVAFTHGSNDAQKTMGVIALALYAEGRIDTFYIPTWVKIAAGLAIAAGTYSGGWRIMRTLGQRVYQLEPRERLRRAGDRRRGDLGLDEVRLPALDDARRHGRRDGRRLDEAVLRRQVGRRREHRRRLGADTPGGRARRRAAATSRSRRSSDEARARTGKRGDVRADRGGGRERAPDRRRRSSGASATTPAAR